MRFLPLLLFLLFLFPSNSFRPFFRSSVINNKTSLVPLHSNKTSFHFTTSTEAKNPPPPPSTTKSDNFLPPPFLTHPSLLSLSFPPEIHAKFQARNFTRLAVIVAPSFSLSTPFVIRNFYSLLPPSWHIVVLTSPSLLLEKEKILAYVLHGGVPFGEKKREKEEDDWKLVYKHRLTLLAPAYLTPSFPDSYYSCLLLHPSFYLSLLGDHIMIFDDDSLLLSSDVNIPVWEGLDGFELDEGDQKALEEGTQPLNPDKVYSDEKQDDFDEWEEWTRRDGKHLGMVKKGKVSYLRMAPKSLDFKVKEKRLGHFEKYVFVSSPVDVNPDCMLIGDGGLSLRNRTAMIDILSRFLYQGFPKTQGNEYCQAESPVISELLAKNRKYSRSVPSVEESLYFSQKSVIDYKIRPFGTNQIYEHQPDYPNHQVQILKRLHKINQANSQFFAWAKTLPSFSSSHFPLYSKNNATSFAEFQDSVLRTCRSPQTRTEFSLNSKGVNRLALGCKANPLETEKKLSSNKLHRHQRHRVVEVTHRTPTRNAKLSNF